MHPAEADRLQEMRRLANRIPHHPDWKVTLCHTSICFGLTNDQEQHVDIWFLGTGKYYFTECWHASRYIRREVHEMRARVMLLQNRKEVIWSDLSMP